MYGSRYVKFNSKSIKFPKLHKETSLGAINIKEPWSEWKERLKNLGVKQPKRGIELGWVTRGTRPKKPPSSRGFAREARGARGIRGIENRKLNIFLVCYFEVIPYKTFNILLQRGGQAFRLYTFSTSQLSKFFLKKKSK